MQQPWHLSMWKVCLHSTVRLSCKSTIILEQLSVNMSGFPLKGRVLGRDMISVGCGWIVMLLLLYFFKFFFFLKALSEGNILNLTKMSRFRSRVLTSSCPKFERLFAMAIRFLFSLYFLCLFFFCEKFGRCLSRPNLDCHKTCLLLHNGRS